MRAVPRPAEYGGARIGIHHTTHKERGSVIRRYIIWRNRHTDDQRLQEAVGRANAA